MNGVLWVWGFVAFVVAALCSAADGALLGAERQRASRNDTAERSRTAREAAERTHRALSMARVLAYLIAGAALAEAAGLTAWPLFAQVVIAFAATAALVSLSEGAARALGFARGEAALRTLAPVMRTATFVLAPVVLIGATIESVLRAALPEKPRAEEDRETSAEQFMEVVAAEADVSERGEALMHGVFSLGDTEVSEIMMPRVDIVGVEATTPWSEVIDRVRSAEHSRLPVYEETLDEVVGILYAKDLLPAVIADEEPSEGWRSLVRPAQFIPTSKTIDAQLRDFKQGRTHIAIVSDEYGGTAGLVTIEDVLEEIVGDIRDEYDQTEPEVEREGDARFWVSGRLAIDELTALLGTDFAIEDVQTVGGLVYTLFGRVPRSGDALVRENYRIVVERVHRRSIDRVYFERLTPIGAREEA